MMSELHRRTATTCCHRYSREVYRLADALMFALHIPAGYALAQLLMPHGTADNRDAVAAWLARELQHPDTTMSQYCIELLLPKLEQHLLRITEDACHAD